MVCSREKLWPDTSSSSSSQDHLELGVSIVPVSNILVVFALGLVAVDLGTIQHVQQDPIFFVSRGNFANSGPNQGHLRKPGINQQSQDDGVRLVVLWCFA